MSKRSRPEGSLIKYEGQSGEHGYHPVVKGEPGVSGCIAGRRSGLPEGVRYLEQGEEIGRE